jgi:hypothetical protein
MKIKQQKLQDASSAFEAFSSVRKGVLDKFNEADLEITVESWLYWCDQILRAEKGMLEAVNITRQGSAKL